jgi:hypothetical protein
MMLAERADALIYMKHKDHQSRARWTLASRLAAQAEPCRNGQPTVLNRQLLLLQQLSLTYSLSK